MIIRTDLQALALLKKHGIRELKNGLLHLERYKVYPDEVWDAVAFLIDEWDYSAIFPRKGENVHKDLEP